MRPYTLTYWHCHCDYCRDGRSAPAMCGLGDLPALDSPEVQRLGAQALRLLDHPLTRKDLQRRLRLPLTSDRAILLTARVLRHLQNKGLVHPVEEAAWVRLEERLRAPAAAVPVRQSQPAREREVMLL